MSRKGHIMGSKPAKDPWADVEGSGLTVGSTSEIRWSNRKARPIWTVPLALTMLSFMGVFWLSILVIFCTGMVAVTILLVSRALGTSLRDPNGRWSNVSEADFKFTEAKKTVEVKGTGGFHVVGLDLKEASIILYNSLSTFIRAVPMTCGFCLKVSMRPVDANEIAEGDVLSSTLEKYFRLGESPRKYIENHRYAGVWKTNVTVLGLIEHSGDREEFEASVRGSLPSKKWNRIKPSELVLDLPDYARTIPSRGFYTVGKEISEWLVQLSSELSSEMGINVPGQFIVDIKQRPSDYLFGKVLNPDTLRIGPPTGLTHDEISDGLLLCGSDWVERRRVLVLLIKQLVDSGKKVMVLSSRQEALEFTALSESAVGLTLGKDFVLNPVNPEGVHRTDYVPQLMMALEGFTEKNLSISADLEKALGRAVALSNSTVTDITLDVDDTSISDAQTDIGPISRINETKLGMEAVRRLHQGVGARAFYGTQTVLLDRLKDVPLSVVVMALGSTPLDMFAWDLFMMKLGGLRADKDLVIIMDDPESFRVIVNRHTRRESWMERLVRKVASNFSLVVSMDQPAVIPEGVSKYLSSCIALQLRSERDIAMVSSMLGLSVIATGMHTKARWSPRESSFLRAMDAGRALIVHNTRDTCQPVILDDAPILLTLSEEDMTERLADIRQDDITSEETGHTKGLIEVVTGRDGGLAKEVLSLLERYEPLTEEAVRKFIKASGTAEGDIEGVIIRLRESGMILEGHENHSGVSYRNYRLTMKGTMALRQTSEVVA
ncbi:MAG: hypothetical protein ACTSV2_07000 [Candidatus Thorarchaeota archaeon]